MKMVKISLFTMLLVLFCANIEAQDPNFHIYLCFGQSNMEGQGAIESQDQMVEDRFEILQAVNCSGQSAEQWRTATPPLCRCSSGLGPADYFGRTMVENLPSEIRVGIVHVSVAGCKIELFDKNNYSSYANGVEQWMKNIIAAYNGNPYGRLVDLAKIAQQDGVIKGILLHQGESNSGDQQWPSKVNGVYTNLLSDLGLVASEVPLLAGEVVGSDQGGQTAGMNSIIQSLPNTIPTAHVISSAGCTDQSDNLHFNSAGYRLLGTRYAEMMLSILDISSETPPSIITDLEDVIALENTEFSISVAATGVDLSYQWYQNGNLINGATQETLTLPNVEAFYDGYTYKVLITNAYGTVESNIVRMTVTDYLGVKIHKISENIIIDGLADDIWNHKSVIPISAITPVVGSIFSTDDLSGSAKFLWNDDYLYVLIDVVDDVFINDSENSYEDDAVEIYIDINNDKETSYGADDVQYSFGWDDGTIVGALPDGRSTVGIEYVALTTTDGYVIEARIPWSTLQGTPSSNQLIGLDFMINDDDDGTERDAKLSWNAAEDQAWQDPSLFGTAILKGEILITGVNKSKTSILSIYPNPVDELIFVEGLTKEANYQLVDVFGKIVLVGNTSSQINVSNIAKGVYSLFIENGEASQTLKLIIE